MNSILRRLRASTLSFVERGGIAAVVAASNWRRDRLLVLCYHGVSLRDEHDWSDLYVSPEHLARRIEQIRRRGGVILPLGEALALLSTGQLPARAVALTFDDGSVDFRTKAYPILQREQVPVTLYQSTWHVDKPFPVFDTASSYILWKARGQAAVLPWCSFETVIPESSRSAQFAALHNNARRWHLGLKKTHGGDASQYALMALADSCRVNLNEVVRDRMLQFMSSDELRELDPELVDVQLHTHRHRTPRVRELFQKEVHENRAALRRILGEDRRFDHFCYPSGDYDRSLISWLSDSGVRSATTCDAGLASRSSNPLLIPRLIDTMSLPDSIFTAWIDGTAEWVRWPFPHS